MSPYLFILIINYISKNIQSESPRYVLFIDDIVLIGNSFEELNGRFHGWRESQVKQNK